jgi:hypothetical protein
MGFFYGVTCFNNLSYEDFTFVFSMFFFINNSLTLDYLTFNFKILAFFFLHDNFNLISWIDGQ